MLFMLPATFEAQPSSPATIQGPIGKALAQPVVAAPAARVGAFYAILLDTMKQGKVLGQQGRVRKLEPAIAQTFNLPVMSQLSVGSRWSSLSEVERQGVIAAVSRYTVRGYAHNFDSYSGEQLVIDPSVATRGPDALVKTMVVLKDRSPTLLSYRLRQYGGRWMIIDVYYKSISQLTTQRADFASALATGGAAALIKKLDRLSENLR